MTLRDALIADTERRGVRRKSWVDQSTHMTPFGYGWRLHYPECRGNPEPYRLSPDEVLADDWEACE